MFPPPGREHEVRRSENRREERENERERRRGVRVSLVSFLRLEEIGIRVIVLEE